MLNALILFAQNGGERAAEKVMPEVPFYQQLPFLLLGLMALFFFIVILPAQRKQRRETESILGSLKKNDEVVTASGIIGIVAHIKENGDEVTLKIDDNARIRVLKSSIVRINKKEEAKDAAAPPAAANTPNTNIKPSA